MAEELLQGNNEKLTSVSVSILKNLDLIPGWYGRFQWSLFISHMILELCRECLLISLYNVGSRSWFI